MEIIVKSICRAEVMSFICRRTLTCRSRFEETLNFVILFLFAFQRKLLWGFFEWGFEIFFFAPSCGKLASVISSVCFWLLWRFGRLSFAFLEDGKRLRYDGKEFSWWILLRENSSSLVYFFSRSAVEAHNFNCLFTRLVPLI